MAKIKNLADVLGVDSTSEAMAEARASTIDAPSATDALEISDATEFCKKVLESREFRAFILRGITIGDIPQTILARLMDHGWGRPPEHVELTGKNGGPIQSIREVRRVVVKPKSYDQIAEVEANTSKDKPTTH